MDLTLAIILIGSLGGLSLFLAIRLSSLNSRSKIIASNLTAANDQIEQLSNEVTELRAENQRLSAENEDLVENVNRLIKNNENALWLLYLLQGALQMCIVVLHDERQQLNGLIEAYKNFVDESKRKRDQRLIRKGAFLVLNFIPGVSILSDLGDILSDLGDLGDIGDVTEIVTETNDSELKDLEVDSDDPMMLRISPGTARNFLEISTEQQGLGDIGELDPDLLNTLIKNAIKCLVEMTKSLAPTERRQRITHVAAKFGEFGVEYERSEETVGAPQAGDSSDSRKKESDR